MRLIPTLLATTSLALASGAYAADAFAPAATVVPQTSSYDWSGIYVGASVGVVQSKSVGNVVYGTNDLAGQDWTAADGFFTGEIYQGLDTAILYSWVLDSNTPAPDDWALDQSAPIDLGPLDNWVTEFDTEARGWTGNAFIGAQTQIDSFIVGGELRVGLGSSASSYSKAWSDETTGSASVTCSDLANDCSLHAATPSGNYPNVNQPWDGTNELYGNLYDGTAAMFAELAQTNAISFGVDVDTSISAIARVGVAADRAMFYGMAGPTFARVTATTAASVEESGTLMAGVVSPEQVYLDVDGAAIYEWAGSITESRLGFTVGIGAEFALLDNVSLRGEVAYTNLGDITVTGVSDDTGATYDVTQTVDSFEVTTGLVFRF